MVTENSTHAITVSHSKETLHQLKSGGIRAVMISAQALAYLAMVHTHTSRGRVFPPRRKWAVLQTRALVSQLAETYFDWPGAWIHDAVWQSLACCNQVQMVTHRNLQELMNPSS